MNLLAQHYSFRPRLPDAMIPTLSTTITPSLHTKLTSLESKPPYRRLTGRTSHHRSWIFVNVAFNHCKERLQVVYLECSVGPVPDEWLKSMGFVTVC